MGDADARAQEFIHQAEKKLKSSAGFFGGLMGGSTKIEDAAELYVKAANSFKMAKKWAAAGNAFCEAAKLNTQMQVRHDAASNYTEASTVFKKCDANEAVNCLLKANEIYTDMGKFSIAARNCQQIAETCEMELNDIPRAIQFYEQAADLFKGEDQASHANKCLLKVAEHAALADDYAKAIEIYEGVAVHCMNSSLLKYSARDYFFKASICRLCQDVEDTRQSMKKYEGMFPQFADSREYKLLGALLDACEEDNGDQFSAAIADYDSISRLDQWYTSMLLKVKKTLESEGDIT